jgi:hypothetical protein
MDSDKTQAASVGEPQPKPHVMSKFQVPARIPAVALLEGSGTLLGLLDSDKKQFMLLPGVELPMGPLASVCSYQKAHASLQPSIYLNAAQGSSDYEIMRKKVASLIGEKSEDYMVVRMYFKVKYDQI